MPYAGRSGGRHSRVKFAFFAIVLLGGILQAPAEAQMHSSGMGMGTVMVQGHPHLVPTDLANKINSQDWTGLTASQLAKAGIYPGMSSANGAPKATVKPRTVQRQSAFGCTANVCIYVFGQGTYVSDWDTSAANGYGYFCSFAAYYTNASINATSNQVCGSGDFWAYWNIRYNFPKDTVLCNRWVGFAGTPCELVY